MHSDFPRREAPTLPLCLADWWHSPNLLDREADALLMQGRVQRAEFLANRAAELRGEVAE